MPNFCKNYIICWSRCKTFGATNKTYQTSTSFVKNWRTVIPFPNRNKTQPVEASILKELFQRTSYQNSCWHSCLVLDSSRNCVAAPYHNSELMGKAAAKGVFKLFGIDDSKLFKVHSDIQNVNLSLLDILEDNGKDRKLCQLVNIGICGLHTWHNSMKYGENSSV